MVYLGDHVGRTEAEVGQIARCSNEASRILDSSGEDEYLEESR